MIPKFVSKDSGGDIPLGGEGIRPTLPSGGRRRSGKLIGGGGINSLPGIPSGGGRIKSELLYFAKEELAVLGKLSNMDGLDMLFCDIPSPFVTDSVRINIIRTKLLLGFPKVRC